MENDQPIELSAQEKFDNCTHRSEEEHTITIHRCKCQGGDYRDTGYKCFGRNIFKVSPSICEFCSLFRHKNTDYKNFENNQTV